MFVITNLPVTFLTREVGDRVALRYGQPTTRIEQSGRSCVIKYIEHAIFTLTQTEKEKKKKKKKKNRKTTTTKKRRKKKRKRE